MSETKGRRVTAEHYKEFKRVARATCEVVGLDDWEIRFMRDPPENVLAYAETQVLAHVATLMLPKAWKNDRPTRKRIRYCGVHEVVHTLLAPIADLAAARYVTEDELRQATERVTVRLSNMLLPLVEERLKG